MLRLYHAIWRVSWQRQIWLILLSMMVAALAAVPLSFQKDIVNALTDKDLSASELTWLCAGMLGVILVSLTLKFLLGYRASVLGEDVIRLLRNALYDNAISRAGQTGHSTRSGTLATAISAEAEELGKFTGSAFSEPIVQIGTLVSVIGFIAATQPRLGVIALAIIIPQVIIVLMTQQRVDDLVAERVRILRAETDRVAYSDLAEAEQAVRDGFDAIFETRRRMFLWKLSTKFAISGINGVGTVGVLLYGGSLVLQGVTDVGTVVAATLGLNRLQAPTAFLIAFYRLVSATRVKFELLRELLAVQEDATSQNSGHSGA